jgi:hypothetical protein
MSYIIMAAPQSEGIASTISVLSNIEKILWTVGLQPNAIRSHLPGYTGDQYIDKFLGLDFSLDILPPIDPWKITTHKVISFSDFINLCMQGFTSVSDVFEIGFQFQDWGTPLFPEYMSTLEPSIFSSYNPILQSSINASIAKKQASKLLSMFTDLKKKVVFCNIRRGEISLIRDSKISNYFDARGQTGFYYPFLGKYVNAANISDTDQAFRFISIEHYLAALYDLIDHHGRESLFIVASTDGYSKVLEHFGRKSDLIKPVDNNLIDILNSEFSEVKNISNLFLPGGSAFHTRFSIIYSAIADTLVNGPSNFPVVIKATLGFPAYSKIINLTHDA